MSFYRVRTRIKLKSSVIEPLSKIRIKDIARMAGVSAGTVDRVIHNRGQVSEENRELIGKIIEELNYKPNLLARSLASKRSFHIVTLLPESHLSKGYWEAPWKGIQKAAKEIADYNVLVTSLNFEQFKVGSFRESVKAIIDLNPDAVLLAPVFKSETIELAGILNAQSIPYIFIDSNVEGLGNLSYFGQHSYQSGFMAARLLELGLPEKSTIAILKPTGDISNQMVSRESGFNAFFEREGLKSSYDFKYISYDLNNEVKREEQLKKFFDLNDSVAAALVFNSRVYEIASFLEKYSIENVRLIGYDLLRENAEYLRKGIVTFLLAQRPEDQGYYGVMSLFNFLVLKKEVVKVQYVPIDILTRENLDYYLNFK